jgi:type III secretory pathway component EscS
MELIGVLLVVMCLVVAMGLVSEMIKHFNTIILKNREVLLTVWGA